MAGNTSYTTIIATTLQNFSNKILDNVTTNNTLAYFLKKKGNIKVVSGGKEFVHQLLYTTNSSFAARTSMGTVPLPVTDPITASEWAVKVLSGSIVLPELDVAMNAGSKEKLLDYSNGKRIEAEVSMGELLGNQMFTAIPGADDFDSIPKIIAEDPSTEATAVGGMTGSASSWWRNISNDSAITSFSNAQAGINAIDTSMNDATFGSAGPKIIITTKAIFTYYMLSLTSNVRYSTLESGDAGFKHLMYANLPFLFDDNCPAGNLYGIDTDNLKLQVLAQGNMKQSPFKFATNQLATSALMFFFANLTCGSRRTNFVIDSIIAA